MRRRLDVNSLLIGEGQFLPSARFSAVLSAKFTHSTGGLPGVSTEVLDSLESKARERRGPPRRRDGATREPGQREPLAQERVNDEVLEHARVARRRRTRSCGSWRMARRSRSRLCGFVVVGGVRRGRNCIGLVLGLGLCGTKERVYGDAVWTT